MSLQLQISFSAIGYENNHPKTRKIQGEDFPRFACLGYNTRVKENADILISSGIKTVSFEVWQCWWSVIGLITNLSSRGMGMNEAG